MNELNGTTVQELLKALQQNDFATVLGHLQNNATIFNPTTRNFLAQEFIAQPVGFNALVFVQRLQTFIETELQANQIALPNILSPPTPYVETVGKVSFDMKFVQGGTFQMGNPDTNARMQESPAHEVSVSSFYLGATPVTQALWQEIMGNLPAIEPHFAGDNHPIIYISWEDALDFIQKLNARIETERGENPAYTLPTEAQWEYAARGGINQPYKHISGVVGNNANMYPNYAHFGIAKTQPYFTLPANAKQPNNLGLHGMAGNVWDWCLDAYKETTYNDYVASYMNTPNKNLNPLLIEQNGENIEARVVRGGAYNSGAIPCSVWFRHQMLKTDQSVSIVSFRLCRYASQS